MVDPMKVKEWSARLGHAFSYVSKGTQTGGLSGIAISWLSPIESISCLAFGSIKVMVGSWRVLWSLGNRSLTAEVFFCGSSLFIGSDFIGRSRLLGSTRSFATSLDLPADPSAYFRSMGATFSLSSAKSAFFTLLVGRDFLPVEFSFFDSDVNIALEGGWAEESVKFYL